MKKILLNVFVFILATTISLLGAEFVLGFFDNSDFKPGSYYLENFEFKYSSSLNSDGFRDEEFIKEKKDEVRRIFLIGDSFVQSPGSNDDYKIDVLLEKELSRDGQKTEVFNLGFPSGDTQDYVEVAKQFKDYDPDLVILSLYVDNDIKKYNLDIIKESNVFKFLNNLRIKFGIFKVDAARAEEIYHLTEEDYQRLIDEVGINIYLVDRAGVGDNQAYYDELTNRFEKYKAVKKNILKVREIFKDAQFLLLINPSKYQTSTRYFDELRKIGFVFNEDKVVDHRLQDSIKAWALENDIEVIDPLPTMLSLTNPLYFHVVDDHYNDNGNALTAAKILEKIK